MATASEATLVFTDIVDSTRLVEQLGDAAAAELWARHDRSVRDLLASPPRPRDRPHRRLLRDLRSRAPTPRPSPPPTTTRPPSWRCRRGSALHIGAVTLRENDAADVARGAKPVEVEGLAKPFAARLKALAGPGQTLVSAAACAALAGGSGALRSHGHYRLKGMAEPVEVFELGRGAAPAFSPPADTDKAYRVVRAADGIGGIWQPVREVPHNLPAERDAFVGRAGELRRARGPARRGRAPGHRARPGRHRQDALRAPLRRVWLGDWPGGVYFCDLSEARTADGVLGAVAVGARRSAGPRRPARAARPRDRRPRRLPRHPRQRRAGAGRRGDGARRAGSTGRRARASSSPAASGCGSTARTCCRSSRCRWTTTRRRDRAVRDARAGAAARLRCQTPAAARGGEHRAAARRPAAGDRAGGGAGAAAVPGADRRAAARSLRAARRRARRGRRARPRCARRSTGRGSC